MDQIGNFILEDGRFTGTIPTITFNVKAQLVSDKIKTSPDVPDYRVYAGGAKLGAGWKEESNSVETNYLALKLDDPSFVSPIRTTFFENAKDRTEVMVWSRI